MQIIKNYFLKLFMRNFFLQKGKNPKNAQPEKLIIIYYYDRIGISTRIFFIDHYDRVFITTIVYIYIIIIYIDVPRYIYIYDRDLYYNSFLFSYYNIISLPSYIGGIVLD